MKKVLVVIGAIILIVVILVIVFMQKGEKNIQIDIEDLANKMAQSGSFEDKLEKVDDGVVLESYNFNSDEVEELVSYQGSGASSEEIVILKVRDKNNLGSIKDKINIRLQDRKEAFESYLPKEVGKIENSVFLTKRNYVILCISNDNTKINELIDSYLK